ncbi:hypothetical protein C8R45DRAFT_947320 [Mycena sanguinolenta]|nr:hypothetical protein C8R45DRAFT_947318 [Mycena sanguinolenta]KAJ6449548.1 hypothetical protein C8R45DRAFT_947320 [Mycena sanguinolenta]
MTTVHSVSANSVTLIDNIDILAQILDIINHVWDTGLMIGMQQLPALLSPKQTYHMDCSLETVRHVKQTPVLFLWMTATALIPYYVPNAEYAVPFFIPGSFPFNVADLSYVLLRFMDKYIRKSNYTRFNLVSFPFKLEPEGTFGLLLFDKKLRKTFKKAQHLARTNSKYRAMQFDIPLSTWPNSSAALREPQIIFNLKRHAE